MPEPTGFVVAVVDDDAAVRDSLADLLVSAGYQVHSFSGVKALLAWTGRGGAACIVSDLSMPGESGLDLVCRLAAEGSGTGCLVIAARVTAEAERKIRQAGVVCLLPKPVMAEQLLRCVAAACRQRSR